MLENKEKAQNIDYESVFTAMVKDLPWRNFKYFMQSSPQLMKKLTMGGHRLDKKNRKHFEKRLIAEVKNQDFAPEITRGIFAHWYPLNQEIHRKLEEYFDSEEYQQYKEDQNLEEDVYAIHQEVFDRIFEPKDAGKWRIILCFSPLKLTDEQADKILQAATESNEGSTEEIQDLQETTESLKQENNKLQNQNDDLRARIEKLNSEDKQLRSERKELRAQNEKLSKQLEAAKSENSTFRRQIEEAEEKRQKEQQSATEEVERENKRLSQEIKQLKRSLSDWETKYENQRTVNRTLEKKIKETEDAAATAEKEKSKSRQELERAEDFATLILDNIDWKELGRELRLTPQMKRKFNSLIRSLNYEEDGDVNLGATLPQFWNNLISQEQELIQNIAQSETREVASGNIEEFWQSLTDSFEDVTISLEARTILLQLLHEIFYRTLSMEDLKNAKAPGRAKAKK